MLDRENKKITIVMPVFNEVSTIEKTVLEINEKIIRQMSNFNILIAEDGSTDGTKEIIDKLEKKIDCVKVLKTPFRKGYSKAVTDAILAVDNDADYILFIDSDGQYEPDDFMKLQEEMESSQADIVMGLRINRNESLYRQVLSRGLKNLEKILFDLNCNDITSAFRLMKCSIAKKLASEIKYSRYNFWSEFTARAGLCNYTIREVYVKYRERDGDSRVYSVRKMPKIVLNEFSAIIRTWLEYRFKEISKFIITGSVGALIILGIMTLLTEKSGLYYPISAAIGIQTSIVYAFIINDKWTFGKIKKYYRFSIQRFLRYNLISVVGLGINESVLLSLTKIFQIHYLPSEIIAILVTFGFNYFVNKKITWKSINHIDV